MAKINIHKLEGVKDAPLKLKFSKRRRLKNEEYNERYGNNKKNSRNAEY